MNEINDKRLFKCSVVSAAFKTAKLRVNRLIVIPKYGKRVRVSSTFLAHDPDSVARVGSSVFAMQTRLYSKKKSHIVVGLCD